MSEWKRLVLAAAILAAVDGTAALVIIVLADAKLAGADDLTVPTLIVFGCMFPPFFLAASLFNEYIKAIRPAQTLWNQIRGLSFAETWEMLRWCPPSLIYGAILLFVVGAAFALSAGSVRYHSGQEFTLRHVVGFSSGAMEFAFVALPILCSVSRMPGAFSDHFAVKLHGTPN